MNRVTLVLRALEQSPSLLRVALLAALACAGVLASDLYCSCAFGTSTYHLWQYEGGAMPPPTMTTATENA